MKKANCPGYLVRSSEPGSNHDDVDVSCWSWGTIHPLDFRGEMDGYQCIVREYQVKWEVHCSITNVKVKNILEVIGLLSSLVVV